jgi:hypothetical protein
VSTLSGIISSAIQIVMGVKLLKEAVFKEKQILTKDSIEQAIEEIRDQNIKKIIRGVNFPVDPKAEDENTHRLMKLKTNNLIKTFIYSNLNT